MRQKRLQKGSKLAEELDANGDGIVTDQELMRKERMVRLENQDKKEDQQRYMVWFSALSVTIFIIVLMLPIVPLDRVDHLSNIAQTWVIANMGIIGGFIASSAFNKKNGESK
tara:strand:+ start:50 stop:385 length:336 start_codon:yes stop_codon:yes gene_type:complete